jgi:hypothetical protein
MILILKKIFLGINSDKYTDKKKSDGCCSAQGVEERAENL